jgi:hypothetical protein
MFLVVAQCERNLEKEAWTTKAAEEWKRTQERKESKKGNPKFCL